MGGILIAVALLIGNAFFVGAEFALVSARRTQIEPKAEAGSRRARTTLRAMERVTLMMTGAQLGITLCSLGLGAVGEPAVAHLLEVPFAAAGVPDALLHPVAFALALLIVVFLHMVLGEMVPKNLALAGPDRAALWLGPALAAVVWVLKPVIVALNAVSNGVLRLLRVQPREEVSSTYTEEEVAALVAESRREGLLDAREHELLTGALSFHERTVSSVLIPENALVTVPGDVTSEQVEARATETGFSRFPVTGEDGSLLGYVHLKDVLESDPGERTRPVAGSRLRGMATLRPTDPLHRALGEMRQRGTHLARVVDADGTRQGVVALEDVLEELVGEIRDAAQRIGRRH
ncbi:hemolysin family protein [Saccharomonospora iraqiensis]|uniref:hemolysin family protein n=1 Tax=Saccharomonospora iraqiensis TaxID=52698 RepID=UPI00047D2E7D|nr:hemolysin family protein [Saccharomonospora iraqiensis]